MLPRSALSRLKQCPTQLLYSAVVAQSISTSTCHQKLIHHREVACESITQSTPQISTDFGRTNNYPAIFNFTPFMEPHNLISKRFVNSNIYGQPASVDTLQARQFSSTPCNNDDHDGKGKGKKSVHIVNIDLKPTKFIKQLYSWCRVTAKIFLMRSYFDETFTRDDFLEGAKQAVIMVTKLMADGNFQELQEVASSQAIEDCRKLYGTQGASAEKIQIDGDQIMNLRLADLDFQYPEDGTKWAYALVECHASQRSVRDVQNDIKSMHEKAMGSSENFFEKLSQELAIRKFTCSFTREYTKGVEDSEWIVDHIEYLPVSFEEGGKIDR